VRGVEVGVTVGVAVGTGELVVVSVGIEELVAVSVGWNNTLAGVQAARGVVSRLKIHRRCTGYR
jgi:hypothetical protein